MKSMITLRYNKNETAFLKGIGILFIILHNLCHWMDFALKENEFSFSSDHSDAFYHYIIHPDANLILQMFSFWGHYGIVFFLFSTGYGLAAKYNAQSVNTQKLDFIRYHYLKLFRLMFVGLCCFHLFIFLCAGHLYQGFCDLLLMQSLFANLIPGAAIDPMPFWYIGMTFQLYILYICVIVPLLQFKGASNGMFFLFCASIILFSYVAQECLPQQTSYMRINFVIGILPFIIGVACGIYEIQIRWSRAVILLVVTLFLLAISNVSVHLWLWAPAFAAILMALLVKMIPNAFKRSFATIGKLSMYLFLVHPIARVLCLGRFSPYMCVLAYLLVCVLLALLLRLVMKFIPLPSTVE